ncbi:MAG: gamma-glutamyl-phosphate reductase, partial [Coprococcus sp.]
MTIETLGIQAKQASRLMNKMTATQKNTCLKQAAQALLDHSEEILAANAIDIQAAREKNMPESLVDRLALTESRIAGMAEGLTQLIALEDPIGEIVSSTIRPNGLEICKKRVPLGVVGIIYESRPNVTADAFGLCFKTNNAV